MGDRLPPPEIADKVHAWEQAIFHLIENKDDQWQTDEIVCAINIPGVPPQLGFYHGTRDEYAPKATQFCLGALQVVSSDDQSPLGMVEPTKTPGIYIGNLIYLMARMNALRLSATGWTSERYFEEIQARIRGATQLHSSYYEDVTLRKTSVIRIPFSSTLSQHGVPGNPQESYFEAPSREETIIGAVLPQVAMLTNAGIKVGPFSRGSFFLSAYKMFRQALSPRLRAQVQRCQARLQKD